MNLVYSQISHDIEKSDFTDANKYGVFFELLRVDHYTKISQNYKINKKFFELYEFYHGHLLKIIRNDELQYFKDQLNELNSSADYPNSKKLSKKYEKYVKKQWKNEIENDPQIQKIRIDS